MFGRVLKHIQFKLIIKMLWFVIKQSYDQLILEKNGSEKVKVKKEEVSENFLKM